MITLGTGKISSKAEHEIGLASEHDYAVLDLREEQGQKLLLIKNPWCEGSTWRGGHSTRPPADGPQSSIFEEDAVPVPRDLLNAESKLSPGTFWMDIHSVEQHFATMYLNWNPGLFTHRQDIHFNWELAAAQRSCSLINNPQFSFATLNSHEAWIVMSRHFQDDRKEHELTVDGRLGFISLSVYDSGGVRKVLKEAVLEKTPFVDSFHTLLRMSDLQRAKQYTAVVEQDGLCGPSHSFTVSVFANSHIDLNGSTLR